MPRSKALNKILQEVAERRGETAPAFTTVLKWIDRWVALSNIHGKASLIDRNDLKGNRGTRIGHVAELAIEYGIRRWLTPGISVPLAYPKVVRYVEGYKRKLTRYMSPDDIALIETPSERTFYRRCADIEPYVRDYFQIGAGYANIFHQTFNQQPLPDRPYQDVEVDHCTLDILLVDDESNLVLGRPDLIIFRDRATGMIIGYSIGYEAPSYASFVIGLRHTMYHKDLSRFAAIKVP